VTDGIQNGDGRYDRLAGQKNRDVGDASGGRVSTSDMSIVEM
jgi:hypothetical protein